MSEKYEIGSIWKTRGGLKAVIVNHPEGGLTAYAAGTGVLDLYPEGHALNNEKHPFDLIEPWKEPRKGAVWVNIYPDEIGYHIIHKSRAQADKDAEHRRLACVEINWTEGQGL